MKSIFDAAPVGGAGMVPVRIRARSGLQILYLVDERHRDNADSIRRHGRVMAIRLRGHWRIKVDGAYFKADPASEELAESYPEMVEG